MVESTGFRTDLRPPDQLYEGYDLDLDETIYDLGDGPLPGIGRLISPQMWEELVWTEAQRGPLER